MTVVSRGSPAGVGLFLAMILVGCGPSSMSTTPLSYRISVAKAGDGSGVVTSVPQAFIHCGNTCAANVARGIEVTLTAKPDPGSTFEGWVDGCSGTGICAPPVNEDIQINALFKAKFAPITVTLEGEGEGRVVSEPAGIDCAATCSASFKEADQVTFRAIAAAGSYFSGWRGGPCFVDQTQEQGRASPPNVTGRIRAVFTRFPPPPPPVLRIVMQGNGGGVVRSSPSGLDCRGFGSGCSAGFDAGTVVELTAVPGAGSLFDHWTDGEDVSYGSGVFLTATPAAGSWFTGWSDPRCGRGSGCYVGITEARTVTATFVPIVLLGNTTSFGASRNIIPDHLTAEQFLIPRSGIVDGLGMIALGNATARMGLYADAAGMPGALLGQTEAASFASGGAEQGLVAGPVSLAAGTYWITAGFSATSPGSVGIESGSNGTTTSRVWPWAAPGLPNPFSAGGSGPGPRRNYDLVME